MAGRSFKTVSLPAELVDEIEKIVRIRKLGYTSVAEFAKDAIREKLKQLKSFKGYIDADSDAEVI
ncbi:MAG: ribbon-helix-helix domain-containing protein [Archaeoglobaceae archaeon]